MTRIERVLPLDADVPLEPAEVEAMTACLSRHFHCQVRPIEEYCQRLDFWMERMVERLTASQYEDDRAKVEWLRWVRLQIRKSNLLARTLYNWEDARTTPCPVHQGRWAGIGICVHGCDETGWLPNELGP